MMRLRAGLTSLQPASDLAASAITVYWTRGIMIETWGQVLLMLDEVILERRVRRSTLSTKSATIVETSLNGEG